MAAPRTKLFVGHLPDGCTNDDLLFLFGKYGTVTECDVINKYGFVHFSSSQEADDAIKALNNYNFRGSSLSVEQSKSKLHHEPGAPGRARGGAQPSFRGRGGRFEGRPSRGGYSNGYQRFDGPPPFGGNRNGEGDYYDRYGGEGMGPRVRPYPPYERPSMGMSRDEYSYRPSPYSVPSREPYSREPAPLMPPRDLYERRPTSYPSRSDYLYSRRSPPSQVPSSSRSPYWFNDPYEPASRTPPTATRRPYF